MNRFVNAFHRRFNKTVQQHGMLQGRQGALVAFSGGPDSTALLACLAEIRSTDNFPLAAIHVNHGLRGTESDEDATSARQTASALAVDFYEERLTLRDATAVSEDTLRQMRYGALAATARKLDTPSIFLGHQAEDLAETLLMRLARGAGLDGLTAFGPVEPYAELRLMRPLLEFSRDEILRYLQARQLPYRLDSSNEDKRFTRNRIRHEILPLLRQSLNPRMEETLARTARLLSMDADYLQRIAQDELERRMLKLWPAEAALDTQHWADLHSAIQTRVLRALYSLLQQEVHPPYSDAVLQTNHLLLHGRNRSYIIAQGNIVAWKEKNLLRLLRMDTPGRPKREEILSRVQSR